MPPTLNHQLLRVGFRLRKAHHFGAFLPLTAFLQKFHPLETLQDISFGRDGAGPFETAMLRHKMLLCSPESEGQQ